MVQTKKRKNRSHKSKKLAEKEKKKRKYKKSRKRSHDVRKTKQLSISSFFIKKKRPQKIKPVKHEPSSQKRVKVKNRRKKSKVKHKLNPIPKIIVVNRSNLSTLPPKKRSFRSPLTTRVDAYIPLQIERKEIKFKRKRIILEPREKKEMNIDFKRFEEKINDYLESYCDPEEEKELKLLKIECLNF